MSTTNTDPATSNRLRNLRLAALIESWLQDESREDERIGPLLDQFLAENPIRIGVHLAAATSSHTEEVQP